MAKEIPNRVQQFVHVNVRAETKPLIAAQAKSLGLGIAELLHQSMLFFKRTGVNPQAEYENNVKALHSLDRTIKNIGDRIIGFIREQETSFHRPAIQRDEEMLNLLSELALSKGATATKKVVAAATTPATATVAVPVPGTSTAITDKDNQLYKLGEELKAVKADLLELLSKVEISKTQLGKHSIRVNGTEVYIKELKAKYHV